ncbi:uracil-DNA glycosylase family protein, partial [Acinetobacter baumannii]
MIIEIETHPLQPFLPENARLLMLGSFPPPRNKWKMDFYYPNFQNDMWRIFGLIFFQDKTYFLSENQKSFNEEAIRSFLIETG